MNLNESLAIAWIKEAREEYERRVAEIGQKELKI